MPPVVAAIPGILINFAVGAAVNLGVGLAINAITGAGQQTQTPGVTPSGVRLEPRVGLDVPVGAIFGRMPSPGRFLYQNSFGTDNEFLQLVYDGWRGWHDALEGLLVDNKPSTLSGSNADSRGRVIDALTVEGTPYGWVKYYTGAPGQVADPELVLRANPSSRWPATKKLTGSAYCIVTLRFKKERFNGAIPVWRFIWRGLRAYDRRKDSTQPGGSGAHRWGMQETYEWTENPAILQDNWRRGIWINGVRLLGLGVSEHACHHSRIVAAANLCDEQVEYEDTGRTLPRYVFGAELTDDLDTISVMRMFEQAMAGFGVELGGAYAPLPAQTMVPVLTLKDSDRVLGEDVSERKRMDPTQVKTAYHGMFVSPEDGWMPKEYGLRRNAVLESADGGRRQGKLDLTSVPYQETAAMIAEIFVRRDSFQGTETAVYGPKAAKLEPGDVVTRVSSFFGTIQMMVWSISELSAAKRQITFREWDNTIVPDADTGFVQLPATTIPAPVPARPITVSAFLLVAVAQVSGTTTVPALRATWTPITDQTVDRVIIKYWPQLDPSQVRFHSVEAPGSGMVVIENAVPETTYVATATIVTTPPRTTVWCAEQLATTGPIILEAEIPPGGIVFEKLGEDVAGFHNWIGGGLRDLIDQAQAQDALSADEVLTNALEHKEIRRSLNSQVGQLQASFEETITTAIIPLNGQVQALADAFTELSAGEVDGEIATSNFRMTALSGPTGYARIGAQTRFGGTGDYRGAAWFLDTPNNPLLPTRFVVDAEQFVVTDGINIEAPFVFEGGVAKMTAAKIGTVTSGRLESPDGEFVIDLATKTILITL